MIRKFIYCASILLCSCPLLSLDNKWEEYLKNDDITLYTRDVPDYKTQEVKVVTIIRSDIEVILAVLNDISSAPEWVPNCKEARLLKRIDENNYYMYRYDHAPWPVSDRDIIARFSIIKNLKEGKITVNIESSNDINVPLRNDCVRICRLRGTWELRRIDRGSTEVSVISVTEPAGNLPVSVGNYASRDVLLKTVQNIRKMVQKEK